MLSRRAVLDLEELGQRLAPSPLLPAIPPAALVPPLPPAVEILGLLEASRPRPVALVPVPVPIPVVRYLPVVVPLVQTRVVVIPVAVPIFLDKPPVPLWYVLGELPLS